MNPTTNPPAVPVLRYSVGRMLRDAVILEAMLGSCLDMAWRLPASPERSQHIDALAGAWQGLREWRAEQWYLEADWEAACARGRRVFTAFGVWAAGVVVTAEVVL